MAPDTRVRNGALGARAALAARNALCGRSVSEMQDGLGELKEILLDEVPPQRLRLKPASKFPRH